MKLYLGIFVNSMRIIGIDPNIPETKDRHLFFWLIPPLAVFFVALVGSFSFAIPFGFSPDLAFYRSDKTNSASISAVLSSDLALPFLRHDSQFEISSARASSFRSIINFVMEKNNKGQFYPLTEGDILFILIDLLGTNYLTIVAFSGSYPVEVTCENLGDLFTC